MMGSPGRLSAAQLRVPVTVLLLSLVAALVASTLLWRAFRQRDEARFRNAVEAAEDRIRSRLDTYVALLQATRGFLMASHSVNRAEFREFVGAFDLRRRYPGVQGLGFTRALRPGEREALERAVRAEPGLQDFRVWPETPRAEYHSIVLLEPQDRRNRAALGYDMYTEATRQEAMARARDTGRAALSGRVTLVQEIEGPKQAGFLLYVPVYRSTRAPEGVESRRAALEGFVYSPFRADDLFRGIFGTESAPRVAFRVYDGRTPEPAALLHDSRALLDAPGREAAFALTRTLEVGGRPWTLVYTSLPAFEQFSRGPLVPAFVVGSVLFSLALF
ncbi:MAG TPA: CHASE domain-containing protein, partial [Aggregicoccus sp.]|nr:CHASE domain-containing protein [Aggregicoccus sp.]